jgi:hypothetical protein
MSISFDKDTAYLYHYILQESSATHIKASGFIRKILLEHYDNREKTRNAPKETRVPLGAVG